MVILKLEKINFAAKKVVNVVKKDVDIERVLVSNRVSFGEKTVNILLVICTMIKVNPLHIMLPKASVYVKVIMDKRNECIFWLKMMTY